MGVIAEAGATMTLARFIASTQYDDLPDSVVEQARLLILDSIGVMLLGSRTEIASTYVKVFRSVGESSESTVIGYPHRLSAYGAALTNAAFMHQVEFGEACERAVVHPTSGVIPATLSVADREHAPGKDVLRAAALGCEALIRFGYALATDPAHLEGDNPPSLWQGWFPPNLLSPIGASTAASLLMHAQADVLHHAWGLATNLGPATTINVLKDGLTGKGAFMGVGSANGILAADLARDGVTGLRDIVGDWMPVIVPAYDSRRITDGLGERYEMTQVRRKYFAFVGPIAPPLEATFDLLEEHTFSSTDVEQIIVEGYRRAVMMARPVPPTSPEGARGNLVYAVASAIVSRDRWFFITRAFQPEALGDPRTLAIARRIKVMLNDEYQRQYPHHANKCRVIIRLRDGRVLSREVDLFKVDRYYSPSRADIADKFGRICADVGIDDQQTRAAIEAVWSLEAVHDARELTAIVGRAWSAEQIVARSVG